MTALREGAGPRADAALLARRDHPEPHRFLGAHLQGGGVVVRAYRPGAVGVEALLDDGRRAPLAPAHVDGLFEGPLDAVSLPVSYRLAFRFPAGEHVVRDPYAFLPTLGELDLHLLAEGRHEELGRVLGAHVREVDGVEGVAFAVWAPEARSVSVVGDWNGWDGRVHPLRTLGGAGLWELFVPEAAEGARYKLELRARDGALLLKADPVAWEAEPSPGTASVVTRSRHAWRDEAWLAGRAADGPRAAPLAIYEAHLPSWRRGPDGRPRGYRELADELGAYVRELGFTHVELLPVQHHPYSGSWGYQVTGYFAPYADLGSPDDLRWLVDRLHAEHGLGVILDWVPAHFPRDAWALARFDGSALYEHVDPREGEHPDWGTLVFNFGRNEVRNFLVASALHWLEEYHADGLRVDAVASMLYRDYSRGEGQWLPNVHGGRENLEAISFLRELTETVHARVPGALLVAEESTAWPGVTRPPAEGGLGFDLKWNMGWMHDTLDYLGRDPVHRRWHHDRLTFGLVYAWSERFVLPLSHDEVVHGKGSLLGKAPGDAWQRLATLRALYAHMWAHPGRKLLFMGGELGQEREWSADRELDWGLLADPAHAGLQRLVGDLNRRYREEPALWELDDEPAGFAWLVADDAPQNVLAYVRRSRDGRVACCLVNLSPVPRIGYRVGLPAPGAWRELVNTDAVEYGGSGLGNLGRVEAEPVPWDGLSWSAAVLLPPLAGLWLVPC
ncbi:MAG: 1,4-alpha-glucan branching protein GlgB [Thermoleophilia bacterium]